jgi:XTP/dITP diphosphohydrolase/tetrapyrrole methylase family protein/MazG family protein/ATP diphosphatase
VATEHRAPTDHERSSGLVEALARLDELAKHLRRECPWDAEQDERSIVPHTVEEAYELADAAHSGDDAKLLDELGDVLYQVYFLSLLLEEREAGDLAAVADNTREKLIRRHPHVFGEAVAGDAAEAIRSWGAAKRDLERGGEVFGEIPETLPGPLYALKMQKRLANAGLRERSAGEALGDLERLVGELREERSSREERFAALGELLFAAVDAARALEVDPELAVRAAAERFRQDHES